MKRRPVRYTLLLARSGGGSRALTFPGWAVGLFLAFLALWTGVNLYLWHRAREVRALEARLHALSQEARRLSLALEAEKAKNGALSQEAERTKKSLRPSRRPSTSFAAAPGFPP